MYELGKKKKTNLKTYRIREFKNSRDMISYKKSVSEDSRTPSRLKVRNKTTTYNEVNIVLNMSKINMSKIRPNSWCLYC